MEFHDVYHARNAEQTLFHLLAEREPHQNISHRTMPHYDEHCAFVRSRPYPTWMLIYDPTLRDYVGALYITQHDEIGLFVFKAHRGRGIGTKAMEWIRATYPGRRLLANINPANTASIAFFEKHGARHIQNTYEL